MAPLIVGLSGTTNSGKTSLSNRLKDVLPDLTVFNMDDYYHEENDKRHILLPEFNNYANWEIVSSVDFDRLIADVQSVGKEAEKMGVLQPVIVIEGIIIFAHRALADLCDLKYFLTLPKDECWERRRMRNYLPPEPTGYFEAICWPEYLKHKETLNDHKDIVFLDGTVPQAELFTVVHNSVIAALALSKE